MTTRPDQAIWHKIQASNAAWTGGRPDDVADLFHDDVVMTAPDGTPRVVGKPAMVQSYIDYCQHATTQEFAELDHTIHVTGDTAVVNYQFRIRYEIAGQTHSETGRELLVLTRCDPGWKVVWRMQVGA